MPRLAASPEVVARVRQQGFAAPSADQAHDLLAHFISKGFAPEAAAQLAARQSIPTRFA